MRHSIIILGLLLLGASNIETTNNKLLIGYWPLTDGFIRSSTVGSNRGAYQTPDCTVNGGATFTSTGITLSAGSSQYLDCGDHDLFSHTDGAGTDEAFSVGMWVNPTSQQNMHVFSKIDGATREWTIGSGSTAGKPLFILYTDASNTLCERPTTAYTDTGTWHLYVWTYSGSETLAGMKHYHDGVETTAIDDCSAGSYTGMSNTTAPLKFGYNSFSYSSFIALKGFMVDYEMGASEIAHRFSMGRPGNDITIDTSKSDVVISP
jgi:hypothetical protein